MSDLMEQTIKLLKMLPQGKQQAFYEFVKDLVLDWDPDFTKVTEEERVRVEASEKSGFTEESDIDWKNIGKD